MGELTALLRDNVLLPLDPTDGNKQKVFADVQSGILLPTWHCAFKICTATNVNPNNSGSHLCSYEQDLWQHLQHAHMKQMSGIVKKYKLKEMSMDEDEVVLTLYNAALAEKERCSVPMLGHSTDRRTLMHVSQIFRDDNVHVLMCTSEPSPGTG